MQIGRRDDEDMYWRLLLALAANASYLTHKADYFRELIHNLFAYNWKGEPRMSVAFVHLLSLIVSSNVTFLAPVLQVLVKSFKLITDLQNSADLSTNTIDESIANLARVHRLIQNLLLTVPTGQTELFPILSAGFPHRRFDQKIILAYVDNLYKICDYFPGCKENLLDLIVRQALEIDVEIVIEDTGDVKLNEELFESAEHLEGLFSFDAGDNPKSQGFRQTGGDKVSDEVSQMADKLDLLLVSLANFLQQDISKSKREMSVYLYYTLLNIFEERVLAAHKSKFVQYVLFYLAGMSSEYGDIKFYEMFASRLLKIFLQVSSAPLKRQSAVLYLASYLTRARFVPIDFVR